MTIDHVLMIGFGGPPRPEDVQPFLERVTRGASIPPARIAEVAQHYEQTGGCSPYNACALRLFDAVRTRLTELGMSVPMWLGMRNWHPLLPDAIREIHQRRLRNGLGVILAPHRAYASFGRYVENVEEAKIEIDAREVRYDYLKSWHHHPLFVRAQTEAVRAAMASMSESERRSAHVLFTAHSIPKSMVGRSQYEEGFRLSSQLVAQQLGQAAWSIAYQSRSGHPREPWLEPDVSFVIRELKDRGTRHVVLVPIGFLFDHTEVLYDLDVEIRGVMERLGIPYRRAATVMDHPAFVELLAQLIREQAGVSGRDVPVASSEDFLTPT